MVNAPFDHLLLVSVNPEVFPFWGERPDFLSIILHTHAAVAVDSLGRGATGDRVRALQTALAQQGFNQVGKIDGDFGPNTAVAVRAFQTAHGLPVTGVADRATQD